MSATAEGRISLEQKEGIPPFLRKLLFPLLTTIVASRIFVSTQDWAHILSWTAPSTAPGVRRTLTLVREMGEAPSHANSLRDHGFRFIIYRRRKVSSDLLFVLVL